jgi:hypothetical protein
MLSIILIACVLVAVTVAVHAGGLAALLGSQLGSHAQPPANFWAITWLLVRMTWALLLIHATEITVWALFYRWAQCLPDAESAFYFSGVTYATIGYGELVLAEPWRMLAPVEGLTGILMCGLSTAFFFAVVSRVLRRRVESRTDVA